MKIRKYEGASLGEALRKVREDLGKDALILYTHIPQGRGLFGWFGRPKYMIVAGTGFRVVRPATDGQAPVLEDLEAPSSPDLAAPDPKVAHARALKAFAAHQTPLNAPPGESPFPGLTIAPDAAVLGAQIPTPPARRPAVSSARVEPPADFAASNRPPAVQPRNADARELDEVKQMVRELREMVRQGDLSQCEDELMQVYLHLLENNISALLARNLIGRIQKQLDPRDRTNPAIVRAAMRNLICDMISVAGPIRLEGNGCRRIALIGPTGVGKTTTIAKLAADFALREHRRVGLVTLDTYRIAATDQLRKIAEIMDVPLAVVSNPGDLGATLAGFRDRDVVLIDTAGRSQNDGERLQELRQMIAVANPDEVHLVVSVTSQVDHFLDVVTKFSAVRVDRIILSKVDEASRCGLILDVLARVGKGISYLTTGQKIPQDIEPASVPRLANLILGEREPARGVAMAGTP